MLRMVLSGLHQPVPPPVPVRKLPAGTDTYLNPYNAADIASILMSCVEVGIGNTDTDHFGIPCDSAQDLTPISDTVSSPRIKRDQHCAGCVC